MKASSKRNKGKPDSLPQHPLLQLSRHSRIHLYSDTFLGLLEDSNGQVSSSRTDFEHDVRGFKVGLEERDEGRKGQLEFEAEVEVKGKPSWLTLSTMLNESKYVR